MAEKEYSYTYMEMRNKCGIIILSYKSSIFNPHFNKSAVFLVLLLAIQSNAAKRTIATAPPQIQRSEGVSRVFLQHIETDFYRNPALWASSTIRGETLHTEKRQALEAFAVFEPCGGISDDGARGGT